VKLLGRRNDDADDAGAEDTAAVPDTDLSQESAEPPGTRTTAPKGRPTPKRNDKGKKRGPVAPARKPAAR
jgi:hypothetical protein